ncbi:MAG: discoidin domain-containing protein [Phycisphaerae bacterium]
MKLRSIGGMKGWVVAAIALSCTAAAFGAESEWVHPGAGGKLVYKTTERGDRIMDFSHAGYEGGGVALPHVATRKTVQPLGHGEDDTESIQAAIDEVSKLPVGPDGFRGAVQLAAGDFTCAGALNIAAAGVVLRGSAGGDGETTIHMTGERHRAILIGPARGRRDADAENGSGATHVTDAYVPEGTRTFSVEDAGGFHVGDRIAIRRPTTKAWIHFMNMDTLKRDGKPQTWIGGNRTEVQERTITAIDGNRITVAVPLADSYDAKLLTPPGTTVSKVAAESAVNHVGIESLHFQCPPLEIAYGQAPYSVVRVGGDDCWVRDVYCQEAMNATVLAGNRITMENVSVTHTFPNLGASKPSDFSIEGSQILIDRCSVTGDNEYFVWTSSLIPGPNVVLNSTFRGRGSRIQPHQRWSTALLVDNCTVPDGGIDFSNRGVAGSGHGWTMGWAVAWNCIAKTYVIQQPPGTENWAIGCIGERDRTPRYFDNSPVLPEGIFESYGTPVSTPSLYLAQLQDRLGAAALKKIGYGSNSAGEFQNKHVERLPAWSGPVDPELGVDLALHRPVGTSSVRGEGREHGGERALDGDPNTYWATTDKDQKRTFEVDMEGPVEVSAVGLEELSNTGQIEKYRVEGQVDSDWKLLSEGTKVGPRKVDRFPATTVWKVRLTILKATGPVALRSFDLYDPKR